MNWIIFLSLFICFFCKEINFVHSLTSCRNHYNETVDWFILYKMPQDKESEDKLIAEGYGYRYIDSEKNEDWQIGKISLNETKHALFYTIQQIYERSKLNKAHILYNDETPKSHTSYNHGHTKGVVNFDEDGGYWLVHSLPKFPSNTSYFYPPNGRMFGQTFLCMSLNYSQFNEIGKQLFYTYPQIYDSHFPEAWRNDNPNISDVLEHKFPEYPPWKHLISLKSSAGQKFLSFAKYTHFNADIYDAWLAPYFKSSMLTETWQNGKTKSPSNCTAKYKVENIVDINVKNVNIKETKDHSKWGILLKNDSWVCIGGINRMETQKMRAGGMICTNIPNVWRAFNKTISRIECCSSLFDSMNSVAKETKIFETNEEVKKWIYSETISNIKKYKKTLDF